MLHFVTDDLVGEGIVDRLAPAETTGRASGSLEFLFRCYRLERYAAVRTTDQTLRTSPELTGTPATLVCVAEHDRNDFDRIVHTKAPPNSTPSND